MTISAPSIEKSQGLSLIRNALGFRDCAFTTIEALVSAGRLRSYGKGEAVVRRGEIFDTLFFVMQGSIETSLNARDGHRHLISYLQPGSVAGMISVVDGLGHVNDMFARERDTVVLMIAGSVVRELRDRDPQLVRAFESHLAFRSRLMYERLDTHTGTDLPTRMARMIVLLCRLHGVSGPEGSTLALKMSQADYADFLGVTRQRINYALKELRELGLVQVKNSTLTVADMDSLERYSRQQ
jgi:CRP-like cAMP-binding protein